jgi:hypothetical protein
MSYSGRIEKPEEVNGKYVARAIIWVLLASVVGSLIAFSSDTMAKNAMQDTQIAVMQAQYVEINDKLAEIKKDVAAMRQRQETDRGLQLESNSKNSRTNSR